MMKFKVDDEVYVNGRSGIVIEVHRPEREYTVKFKTDFINRYPQKKLLKKHNHCNSCKRRLSDDHDGKLCAYCRRMNREKFE